MAESYFMIQGNQTWQNALAMLQKQPLYTVEIPAFGFIIASFTTAQTGVTTAGYGVGLYGVGAYGT
ncbi:MAG TPA: hypothetical protein VKM93_08440 [Terriglobia bacterium]|nr:hypothetical protein [Terriglobia bacterium]